MNTIRHPWLVKLVFSVGSLVFLFPILWMALSSLKDPLSVTAYPPTLIFEPTLDNYRELFGRTDFLHYTWNSFVVAGCSTLLGLLIATPAAFAISWHRMTWPATVSLFARMAPGTLFLLPWFIMFSNLGLSGSFTALILAHAVITMPLALWILLPYFDGMPREVVESGQIDGCRGFTILIRIIIPMIYPGLVVATIMSFVFSWNYFLFALALSGFDTKTAIVASFNFIGEGTTNWGALMAAATVIALPPLILTFIVQRWLVAGLSFGAVKG
jgi:multiple sugar transport system permease protein